MELVATPKQAATVRLARQSRIAVWEGAVRSGKTIASLIAWADFILTAPPGALLMVGRTTDTLRRNAVDPLTEILGQGNVKVTWGDGRGTILGRQVFFLGADNSAAESRLRGVTLAGTYVDEITVLGGPKGEEWWNMLLTRHSVEGARIIGTTNPGPPSHWLLDNYLEQAELTVTPDSKVIRNTTVNRGMRLHRYRFVIDDNVTLPTEYVDSIKASLSGLFYKRFILGEWVAAEGSIYPMLELTHGPNSHIWGTGAPLPWFTHMTVGIDHGLTNNTHAVMLAVTEKKEIFVLGELVLDDSTLTVRQQAERIWNWIQTFPLPEPKDMDRMGPSEKARYIEKVMSGQTMGLRHADIPVIIDPAAKALRNEWRPVTGKYSHAADNAVLPGISDVATLLGMYKMWFVEGSCPQLLSEMSGYVWDPAQQAKGLDAPLKTKDHGPDALRYGVRSLRVKPTAG